MSTVDRLRQNDPATTRIHIRLRNEASDADLAQALEQNPFITVIWVDFQHVRNVQPTDWGSLLRVIATRETLVKINLEDSVYARVKDAPPALIRAFLQSIQQNTSIRHLHLRYLCLPTDVATFVDTASSITNFSLWECAMEPVQREQGTSDLAAALQRNTNIHTLQLHKMDDVCICSILQGLQSNTNLKSLDISQDLSGATSSAIQQLLESSASIETFGLGRARLTNEQLFRPVARGIIQSGSLCKLNFLQCKFKEEESAAHFREILQNKQNLTSLRLQYCTFDRRGLVQEMVTPTLLRPDSPLRIFELHVPGLNYALPNGKFQSLLRAIERSKLERCAIGCINSQQLLRTLTDSIPLMRVKELKVVIASGCGRGNAKQNLMVAVKNNYSLRSVDVSRPGARDLFEGDDDKTRLVFYTDRNKCLDQWANKPETVDPKVWPEALYLAEKAGPDSLFRGLRSVLGGKDVNFRGGRKRKRPQHYAPS